MKIVIDIDGELFNIAKDGMLNEIQSMFICGSVSQGTPLPKGHGRLVDADALLTSERPNGIADDVWKESHIYKLLSTAPAIIDADTTESEDKR